MKISYNWLKNYLKCDKTPQQLSIILTDIGLEVESLDKIEALPGGLQGVVVGHVLTCQKHPDADKLSVTTVDVGGEEILQIVCGAPNVAAGQKVFVATINSVLYPKGETEGFKIKRSKIRGVESLGMICAEDELGIGESHDGIMVLDPNATVGSAAKDVLKIEDDYLFEIGLTPNRVDAASHMGVARDIAAYLKANNHAVEFVLPNVDGFKIDNNSNPIDVKVESTSAAPRYAGIAISQLKIAPSPEWMQNYLRTVGINPKNNVVDITNFVLHELGQPLHAFDRAKIDGDKIVVKCCKEGTPFTTLDGVERKLSAEDLMICNAEKPMCIGGVFGGEESGVSDTTTDIFLESAYFNPISIRKSAKRHGLNTDASFRFERGVDPNITIYALKRAAMLLKEYAGGVIVSDITDIYPEPKESFRFDVTYQKINSLIGKDIPQEQIKAIILSLDVVIENEKDGVLSVAVPPYRVDVQRDVDLIEDILRIYGYNNVEIPTHVNSSLSYAQKPDRGRITNMVSDMLTAMGFTEIMSNSLTKSSYYDNLSSYKAEECVKILNPLSNDLNVMRQTLIFNALEAVSLNVNRKNGDLKLYEFGNCYRYDAAKKENGSLAPYIETMRLGITICGNAIQPSWNVKGVQSDFFTLKAVAEKLLKRLSLDIYALKCDTLQSDLFGEALTFSINNKELFQIGVVAKKIGSMCDVKSTVYFLEMNFDTLIGATKKHNIRVEELSKYPEVKRDLALLVDEKITFSALREVALSTERKLLKSVSLFDVYQGDKLPEGKKSYALNFVLEDKNQTMTDNVIDRVMTNLIKAFETKTGATIRA